MISDQLSTYWWSDSLVPIGVQTRFVCDTEKTSVQDIQEATKRTLQDF